MKVSSCYFSYVLDISICYWKQWKQTAIEMLYQRQYNTCQKWVKSFNYLIVSIYLLWMWTLRMHIQTTYNYRYKQVNALCSNEHVIQDNLGALHSKDKIYLLHTGRCVYTQFMAISADWMMTNSGELKGSPWACWVTNSTCVYITIYTSLKCWSQQMLVF